MPRTIPALIKAFKVMELFLQEPRAMTVPEIVERLKLPRTSAHEIVNTLLAGGYLYRDEIHHNKFFLGSRLFELGSLYAASFDLFAEGRQVAEKISAICDETVQMAVLEGTEALFVAKADCSKMVRMVSRVGSRLPAHCTAVGKMLLSSLSKNELIELYDKLDELPSMTPNSITSVSELIKILDSIRQRGLAFDDCESNIDVSCIAAPVYNQRGEMIAAMSISVPITRMNMSKQDELSELIRQGTMDFSRRMGYQG